MGLPTPHSAVLRLETDYGLTHAYSSSFQSQLLSGNQGDAFFTANSSVATAAARAGQNILVTAGSHAYHITGVSVDGLTVSVTPNLIQAYSGAGFKADIGSTLIGSSGFGESAIQSTEANRPAYLPAYQNGRDVLEFTEGAKALEIASSDAIDNIFANGGTIGVELAAIDDGAGDAGRIFTKKNGAGTEIWNLVTTSAGGGFCKLLFNYITTGTAGAFTTTGFVLKLGVPQIVELSYNSSTPTVAPVITIIDLNIGVTVTTAPTGTALSDAGGGLIIGNNAPGNRGFNGRLMAAYAWKRVLNGYERKQFNKYLAAKWGMDLFFNPAGTGVYLWNRFMYHAEPDSPAGKPLIILLHGGGGSALDFVNQMALGVILGQAATRLYLEATENADGSKTWNSNLPLPTFNRAPDAEYIASVIRYYIALGIIDPTRVFIIGHSNGAMMADRMAVEYPDLITGGIYCIAGVVMVSNPGTYTGKVRHVAGASDMNVPLAGGTGIGGVTYPVPAVTVQKFIHANNNTGVTVGPDITDNFLILPSPAEHIVSSITTAFTLDPYLTTLQQDIYNFIFS